MKKTDEVKSTGGARRRYAPPSSARTTTLHETLGKFGRSGDGSGQIDLLRDYAEKDVFLYYSGDLSLLRLPAVSIVGTRQITSEGISRAKRLARELAESGVLVVSGLAKGVDTVAHSTAIAAGGRTAAVIGTPLAKAYPAENSELQEDIYRHHLLISPFAEGEQVFRSNFPERNKVMALLTDATVIVEASDTSGTLHQAAECQRRGRWLFIMKSVVEDKSLTWPTRFLGQPRTGVLTSTDDILKAIANGSN